MALIKSFERNVVDLTLTRVVFEYQIDQPINLVQANLTLTRVVFEFCKYRKWNGSSYI